MALHHKVENETHRARCVTWYPKYFRKTGTVIILYGIVPRNGKVCAFHEFQPILRQRLNFEELCENWLVYLCYLTLQLEYFRTNRFNVQKSSAGA